MSHLPGHSESWPPLFDEEQCPEAVADKVDFDFISDCEILPAPEPIFDCPDIEVPPELPIPITPIDIDLICPQVQASASAAIQIIAESSGSLFPCELPPSVDVAVLVTREQGSNSAGTFCELGFDFDFDFRIPPPVIPCPDVTGTADAVAVINGGLTGGAAPCGGDPDVDVAINLITSVEQSGDPCNPVCDLVFDFEFLFDFVIPRPEIACPNVTAAGTVMVSTTPTLLSSSGQEMPECDTSPGGSVNITVTPTAGGDPCDPTCDFDFDFDFQLNIPQVCAEITATATTTVNNILQQPPSPPSSSSFEGLFFALEFSSGSSGGEACDNEPTAYVDVTVTKSDNCGSCEYNFDFDFNFDFPTNELILAEVILEDIMKDSFGKVQRLSGIQTEETPYEPEEIIDVYNRFYLCIEVGDKVLVACVDGEMEIAVAEEKQLFATGETVDAIPKGGSGPVALDTGEVVTATSPYDALTCNVKVALSRISGCAAWVVVAAECWDEDRC